MVSRVRPNSRRDRGEFAAAALCAALLTAPGCSSTVATSPSPSATTSLSISGATALTLGLTSQLTALTSLGAAVTSGVTWQSKAPAVATVSATGLLTATGLGTTTITASTTTASGSATIVVASGNTVTTISACTQVTSPGQYVLSGDLPGLGFGGCLVFSGLAGAQLDCGGHAVNAMSLSNVSAMTIRNCVVMGNIRMTVVNTVTVTNCTVINGSPWATNGSNVDIVSDTITMTGTGLAAAVILEGGTNNQVRQNTMTGGYDGSKSNVGTDDGIVLQNETGDTIQGNTISAFYDMGVEGVDVVSNTTVANNTFSNLGASGVGSYWCTSWTGNVIRGNQVSATPTLTLAGYNVGTLCGSVQAAAVFSGNQFAGNVFRNPSPGTLGGPTGPTTVTGPSMYVQMSGTVMGNILQANDFGSNAGPSLIPLTGFIDGGGNICGPLDPTVSNFPCTGGGPQSTRLSMPLTEWLLLPPRTRARASWQPQDVGSAR